MPRSYRDTLFSAAAASDQLALDSVSIATYFRPATSAGTAFQIAGATVLPQGIIGITPDEAGDGIGLAPGNPTVTVGAPTHLVGTVGTIGDQDFYAVTLVAGKTYEVGVFGKTGGANGLPLQDAYVELYDAAGNLVGAADGGASTDVNIVNSGFDALLTVTVETTGTYYINARAFDNDPTVGGNTGEGLGDYEVFANEVDPNDPNVYHPYYNASSPLYAIDWGVQVDGTVRNPDGNEGTRATGNAPGTPDDKGATVGHFGASTEGKNVIYIYFAKLGDVYTPEDVTSPGLPPAIVAVGAKDYEITAVWTALHEFEKVADVVYVETQDRAQADFHYVTYAGTPGPGVSLLGSMSPPQEPDEGLAQFNSADERWNATNLAQGGFSFVTLIHEFGHGHGLAHPHDNGGHSGIMNGVEADGPVADYTTGDFDLNQSVFTMMSYEDGWQSSPYGNAPDDQGYGYLGGLMAFDIAAIQDKYGVNEEWATGNDTYTLKDVNAPGTFFTSIWDGGGTDEIVYSGTKDTTIDLRPATLQYEVGGGGFMSYAYGIYGGFTIANSVVIENATSGDGNDTLWGNAANNVMTSGAGNDRILLHIGGGNDTVNAGSGNDFIYFGDAFTAADTVNGGEGFDILGLLGDYTNGLSFGVNSLSGIEQLMLFSGTNVGTASFNYSLTFQDENVGRDGLNISAVTLKSTEALILDGTDETDGRFSVLSGAGNDILAGGAKGDYFHGGAGNDQLFGLGGNDTLIGGAGTDVLRGGQGKDTFRFENASDSAVGAADSIADFQSGDKIDLSAIDANGAGAGNGTFAFIGDGAFTNQAGQLRAVYDSAAGHWTVTGDIDGNGTADFEIFVTRGDASPLIATDFLL